MKMLAASLGVVVSLAGCSTSPISSTSADKVPPSRVFAYQSPAESTLVVTRDTGFLAAGCNYELYIDGKLSAEFAVGETQAFGLPAGPHVLGVAAARHCAGAGILEYEVELKPGQTLKRRIFVNSAGFHLMPTGF